MRRAHQCSRMQFMRFEGSFIGRVQGVGFRVTSHHLAEVYDVAGWVRNEADGSVRLVVEADEEVLNKFLNELRSRLKDYIRDENSFTSADTGRYCGFEIR